MRNSNPFNSFPESVDSYPHPPALTCYGKFYDDWSLDKVRETRFFRSRVLIGASKMHAVEHVLETKGSKTWFLATSSSLFKVQMMGFQERRGS